MKKTIFFLAIFSLVIFYSCKKKDASLSNLDLLQHKWTDDSLVVYETPSFEGPGYNIPTLQGYTDFRTDGKVYSFKSLTSNGTTVSAFDTAVYSLKDNNTLLTYTINNGLPSIKADTVIIVTLNDKILITNNLTNMDGVYGKFYLHR